jgi:hypothetical protein
MRWVRILPERWASTLWPWSSWTRNVPLGSASATVPSRTKVSSLPLVIVATQFPIRGDVFRHPNNTYNTKGARTMPAGLRPISSVPGSRAANHLGSYRIWIGIDERRDAGLLVAPKEGVVNLDGQDSELRDAGRTGILW